MGKSSKAPKAEITQQERALAEVSSAKWDRYKELYRPVESEYINNVSKDSSMLLRGRNLGDVAQASEGSFEQGIALGQGSAGQLGATYGNLGSARLTASAGADEAGQQRKDMGRINALKIGNDMAADAQSGLAVAARAANSEALGRARAQSIKNEQKAELMGAIGGAASSLYMNKMEPKWSGKKTSAAPTYVKAGGTHNTHTDGSIGWVR